MITAAWTTVRLPDGRRLGIGRDERPQLVAEAERGRAEAALRASEARPRLRVAGPDGWPDGRAEPASARGYDGP